MTIHIHSDRNIFLKALVLYRRCSMSVTQTQNSCQLLELVLAPEDPKS